MNENNSFAFDGTINNYPINYTNKISFTKKILIILMMIKIQIYLI
jgi:hypothetical protein